MIDVSKYKGQSVAGRVLDTADTTEFLAAHPEITADVIPTYGLRVRHTDGEDYLVAIIHGTGEIKVIFQSVYDEDGTRLSEFDARVKDLLNDIWKWSNYPSWYLSKKGSEMGISDAIIGIALIGTGLWIASNIKNLVK